MPSCDFDVVIIGAGPAGSVAALRLKALPGGAARRVLLVDREDFPRGKVCGCCLNGAAVGALDAVGLGHLPSALGGVRLDRWQAQIAGKQITASLPTGWALSREAFDGALVAHARDAGVEVRTGVVARVRETSSERVLIELKDVSGKTKVARAATLVVASGLAGGGLDHVLPWRQLPTGPIGLGTTIEASHPAYSSGTVYMACDATGYAGLVRLEDGRLDIAAAVYDPAGDARRQRTGARVAAILRSAGMPPVAGLETARWQGTPRLHRQRQAGQGRVIAVGDAAGYVEPFTGEGMAWAMQTGVIAAETIERMNSGCEVEFGAAYCRAYRRFSSRRRLPCRVVTAALRRGETRRMLFGALSMAPWLARPAIWMLNRSG